MERAVITGATGMLGRALTEVLVAHGVEVMLLVNPSSTRRFDLLKDPLVKVAPCAIEDLSNFENPTDDITYDTFYHLAWGGTFGAARDDAKAQARNVGYALDAVDLAERLGCNCFVGAGSQAEYGRVDGILRSDTPVNPENGYGMAKLAAGQLTRLSCSQKGIRHVWTRILSVYGPNDGAKTMVMSVLAALLERKEPQLTACEQRWDYLYRDDAAEALRLMGELGQHGAIYPLGSGISRPLCEYVYDMRDAVDPSLPLAIGALPYAPKQVMHLQADINALRADTGFVPKVSFPEGVHKTIAWMEHRA